MPRSQSPVASAAPQERDAILILPVTVVIDLARQAVGNVRATGRTIISPVTSILLLLPRMVVATERLADLAPTLEALAAARPTLDELARSRDVLERLADARPALEELAAARPVLEQLALSADALDRLAETSGQIEKLANATVVAPLQGTAERVGRIVAGFPGNPRRAAARVAAAALATGEEPPADENAPPQRRRNNSRPDRNGR
jgi:hypothetical protein